MSKLTRERVAELAHEAAYAHGQRTAAIEAAIHQALTELFWDSDLSGRASIRRDLDAAKRRLKAASPPTTGETEGA